MADTLDVTNLEKDGRLLAIRKLKTSLYRIQITVTVVFSFLLLFTSGGFRLTPLYVPVESFIYFLLLILLLFAVESFVFRYLEISLSRSRSGRYYMVRNAQKKAVALALLSGLVLLLLITPFTVDAVEGLMSGEGVASPSLTFNNKDVFGLSIVDAVVINADQDVEVYVVTEEVYLTYGLNRVMLQSNKLNTLYQVAAADGDVTIVLPPYDRQALYVVVMQGDNPATANVFVDASLQGYVKDTLPLFALLFVAAYLGYTAWLTPKRYRFWRDAMYE